MNEQAHEVIDQVITVTTTYGLDVVGAIFILIVGWMAAGWGQIGRAHV